MLQKNYKLLFFIFILFLGFIVVNKANGQMMGGNYYQNTQLSDSDKNDIKEGKKFYDEFKNNKIGCSNLKDDDFDKIGEFIMEENIGDSNRHAAMNEMMRRNMGENAEKQMHINLGKSALKCDLSAKGGVSNMMGYGLPQAMSYYAGAMGWGGFSLFWILCLLFWTAVFVDIVLLGIWLWKQIKK